AHLVAGRGRRSHRSETGVRDDGHPRIGHDQHPQPRPQGLEQLPGTLGLVVLVVRDHPRGDLDLEVRREPRQPAGVLRGDQLGRAQRPHQAHRGIQRIADRSGGEGQDSGLQHARHARAAALATRPSRLAGRAVAMTEHDRVQTGREARHRADIDEEPDALLASYRRRLKTFDLPSSRLAWAGALAVFALALVLRLWGLGGVTELIFDETYYVKDGYTLTQEGVEMSWPDEHDRVFEAGDVDTYEDSGSYVVHPSLGKWVIGAGMTLLGADSPWGWRISVAVLGSLSVLMLARIGRRLLRSTMAGLIAGLLLAIDGMHLV